MENKRPLLVLLFIFALLCLGLGAHLMQKGLPFAPVAASCLSLFMVLFLYSICGVGDFLGLLKKKVEKTPPLTLCLPLPLIISYLVYLLSFQGSLGAKQFIVLLYYFTPFLLLYLYKKARGPLAPRLTLMDSLLFFLVWLPVEFGLLKGGWDFPLGQGGAAFINSSATILVATVFIPARGLTGVHFTFRVQKKDIKPMLSNLNLATLAIVPVGLFAGFFEWHPSLFSPSMFIATFFGMLLLVALPEELLFRGILWNFLQKTLPSRHAAAFIACSIFALSHANNPSFPKGETPDYQFILFSGICGFFYGRTWMQTKSLLPAAIVHSLMNTFWLQFLQKQT